MDNITENEITIADLDLLRTIVDLASSRGAFKGAELRQVGEVYEKLTRFLEAVIAKAQTVSDSDTTLTQGE
jgi:hypothetical protein